MADSKIVTGAHVFVYVNGKPYGRVLNVQVHVTNKGKEIRGVDWLAPIEQAPGPASCTIDMEVYRLHRDGGAEGAGFTAAWQDLARAKYFSLLLVDRYTDTVLFRHDRVKLLDQVWSMGKSLVTGRIQAAAIDFQNEVDPG